MQMQQKYEKEVKNMRLNFKTEMSRVGISIEDIATLLCLHRNTVANKLDDKTPINFDEAEKIRDKFFPYADLQYLFKKFN